jgi:hypothetical protein
MVSAWFDHTGILQFDDDDAFFIENYGKEWGYYTWEQFVMHAQKAINIAQWKHLDKRLVFIYNHSSVHKKRGDDALDAKKLNLNPGGKQPQMHNTGL